MTDTGGAAFPRNGHPDKGDFPVDGMTLRDYFAANAMQGYLTGFDGDADAVGVAALAYEMADEMLRAREAQ